jgi:hypothetical protein
MASSPHTRGKSDDGPRTVLSSGWRRRVLVNLVKRDELMRNKKRRLGSFGSMTRSLEGGLRDRRRDEIDELTSMVAGRARARGGDAHMGHGGFERARRKRRGMGARII